MASLPTKQVDDIQIGVEIYIPKQAPLPLCLLHKQYMQEYHKTKRPKYGKIGHGKKEIQITEANTH